VDGLRGITYWDVVGLIALFLIVPMGLLITAYAALVRVWDERRAFRPPDRSQPWHAPAESRAPAMRRDDFYGAQARWTDQEPHPNTAGAIEADAPDRTTRGPPAPWRRTGDSDGGTH